MLLTLEDTEDGQKGPLLLDRDRAGGKRGSSLWGSKSIYKLKKLAVEGNYACGPHFLNETENKILFWAYSGAV